MKKPSLRPKKMEKGVKRQKMCLDMGICPHKFETPLKTIFASKVILF
jgi:hypothetical protein